MQCIDQEGVSVDQKGVCGSIKGECECTDQRVCEWKIKGEF